MAMLSYSLSFHLFLFPPNFLDPTFFFSVPLQEELKSPPSPSEGGRFGNDKSILSFSFPHHPGKTKETSTLIAIPLGYDS